MTPGPQLISIILPVHNQADHLERLVKDHIHELVKVPAPYEMLLVENASRDGTLAACERLAAEFPCVRVVRSEKGGWGRAVRLGLDQVQGQVICYTNSARTSPQDLVICLLYAVAYGDTVVKANRKIRESWRRRLGSLLFNIECRTLFDLSNWDVNGTPKVFPRSFEALLGMKRIDDLIDAEFCVICRRHEYPMVEVPIFSARRHGGRSTTGYGSALRMYWGAIDMWRRHG